MQVARRPQRVNRTALIAAALAIVALALVIVTRLGTLAPASPAAELVRDAAKTRPVGQTDQLVWDYQEQVRAKPNDPNVAAMLGLAYVQKARESGDPSFYSKADAVLSQALKIDPQNIEALIGKGTLALAQHQFRAALALGEQARALNPTIPRIYGVIADAQVELGMYDEAVATVQTMVDKRPDLSSYSRVSYLRELYGEVDGAIAAMDMAVRAGGPNAENTEWTRVQLGNLYFARGDLANAEQQYLTSLSRLPDYVFAVAGLARVRAAQGNDAEAVKLLEQAIARMPLPEFVITLGEIHEAAGRSSAANKQYELVRAMQQLFKAGGVDTDLELALFDADRGYQPAATVTLAQAAYERRPGIKAADTLAWALFKAGKLAEARQYATQALQLGTQDALLFYHAGMIAKAQGDTQATRTLLGRALAINPHFSPLHAPQAREALKQLGGGE